jgi:hypothetical protein
MPSGGKRKKAGRPKGSLGIKNLMWEDLGSYITQEGAERYMEALKVLDDQSFMDRFEKTLEYFKPKQARIDSAVTIEGSVDVLHTYAPRKHAKLETAPEAGGSIT